jgi:hypothetical protein
MSLVVVKTELMVLLFVVLVVQRFVALVVELV